MRDVGHRSSCIRPLRVGTGDLARPGRPQPGTGVQPLCGSPRRGRTWGQRRCIGADMAPPVASAAIGVRPRLLLGVGPVAAAPEPRPSLAEAGENYLSQYQTDGSQVHRSR